MARTLTIIAPLIAYTGVLSGLYLFNSGWAAIIGYHVAMILLITVGKGWSSASELLRGWKSTPAAAMISLCALSGLLIYLLWSWIKLAQLDLGVALRDLGLEGIAWWPFVVYYSLVNPWIEELFWRGWYPDQLARPFIADLLFAGYHVFVLFLFVGTSWAILAFATLTAAARIWRSLRRRYQGLLIPVTSHMMADVSIIAAATLLT